MSSLVILAKCGEILASHGYSISNIDATVIAQKPKLAPYIEQMKNNIAKTLGTSPENVNVKATTEEKLGFTGSGEGISAHAVCIVNN
jgi:2-C-methyl-D-erythritol 2,4-cyclodiphosphate synthase